MRDISRAVLAAAGIILAPAGAVSAHIALSQPSFEAGQNYAAFFKVEQGCDGSPTIALNVQIPANVIVLDTPSKPGWAVSAKRDKGQVTGVTWRGRLAAKDSDQFGLFVKLPAKPGAIYFPVLQQCEKSEIRWSDIPGAGQAPRDVAHPAPVLQLIASSQPATSAPHYMAGDIMIEQPWAPATPRGAATAVAYMTIMNHGSSADTLLGGTSPVGKLDIHQMSMANGIMSMRPVSGGVTIPPGSTVTLSAQGYHFMLSGLKAPLTQGARVPATLIFAKAGQVPVELSVAAIGARAPAGAAAPMGAMPGMPGTNH
jgi:periplasmic copper chaperone A